MENLTPEQPQQQPAPDLYMQHLPMPKQPPSSLSIAVKEAIITGGILAAVAAIATKVPVLNKLFSRSMAREAKDAAVIGGLMGGAVGYVSGEISNKTIYPLAVENTMLKEQIIKMDREKSFAQRIAEEKMLAQQQEHEIKR